MAAPYANFRRQDRVGRRNSLRFADLTLWRTQCFQKKGRHRTVEFSMKRRPVKSWTARTNETRISELHRIAGRQKVKMVSVGDR